MIGDLALLSSYSVLVSGATDFEQVEDIEVVTLMNLKKRNALFTKKMIKSGDLNRVLKLLRNNSKS